MRRFLESLLLLLALAWFSSDSAGAGQAAGEAFSEARFGQLQAQGGLVMIDVSADWCPTCAKQASILSDYRSARPEVPLHVLRVDFDQQKDWVTHFKAPRQSTLILYKGTERVWFSVAETRSAAIFAAIDRAAGRE